MKKVIAILVAVFAFVAVASAQPRALGIRAGLSGVELSYQNTLGAPHFLEADLGVAFRTGYTGLSLRLAYDFVFASANNWNFYAGPSVGLTFVSVKDSGSSVVPTFGAQVGVEYEIPGAPLNISLDYRPALAYAGGNVTFIPADVALGVRFRF